MNIRFAGFGGQGIIMAGYALGRAGVLDGGNALQTQSYGSESRGGTCKSDVIISDGEILDIVPSTVDVLVAMSQPALDKFRSDLKDDGILIYDMDMVQPDDSGIRAVGLRAADIAHKTFGSDIVANAIMLGCLAGFTHVVSYDSLRKAISESAPPKTVETNLQAFDEGFKRGDQAGGA